jgi:hypothetical protein
MIVPDGTKLHLDPRDEYTHIPEAALNYNESMYCHAFDRLKSFGLWMRIGNRPNEGHAEVTLCVYLPDEKVGFYYARAKINDNKQMSAGGMKFEVIKPFQRLRTTFAGALLVMTNPHEMADPRAAFKSNPKEDVELELDFVGVAPMWGGEIVNLDGSPLSIDAEKSVFRGHTEQHMAVNGGVTIGGQTHPVAGFGYRDKSWGPRHWQNFFWYRWLPITFGPDFGMMVSVMGRPDAAPFITGEVFHDGTLHLIRDVRVETAWDDNYYQTHIKADVRTDDELFVLEGQVLSLIPLRHVREVQGEIQNLRITEGMTLYRCNGHAALGMSEYCDLIAEGRPISIALGQ